MKFNYQTSILTHTIETLQNYGVVQKADTILFLGCPLFWTTLYFAGKRIHRVRWHH